MTAGGCCDTHGRTCEPPSELCCDHCTEAAHQMGDATRGYHLQNGTLCSNPNLSPNVDTLKADHEAAARITAAQRKARHLWPGPVGETISATLDDAWTLRSVLGPGSLTQRLLTDVESRETEVTRPGPLLPDRD